MNSTVNITKTTTKQTQGKKKESIFGALLYICSQFPLVFLLIAIKNPLSYGINVAIPIASFVFAEVFFRAPTPIKVDGANTSFSSVVVAVTAMTIQSSVVVCHFIDNKPFDFANLKTFAFTPTWWVCTFGQLCAGILWCTALGQLKGRFTRNLEIVPDHTLLRDGVYRVVRHPGYASVMLLTLSGSLLATRNAFICVAFVLVLYLAYSKRIQDEEAMLIRHFGKDYEDYRKVSGDLVPWINVVPTKQRLE